MVEVFADVGCPFTHVGLCRFVARRAVLGRSDVVLRVRAWPLELVNGRPLDPAFIAEEVDDLRSQLVPDLFTGFDPAAFPSTSLPAMALTATAAARDLVLGERVALAVRHALFEEGRDVADPSVLAAVAAAHGLPAPGEPPDLSAVLADHEEGRRRGVIGSPHFFVADGGFFCPSLDIQRVDGHLQITADEEGFARFLDRCLTGG